MARVLVVEDMDDLREALCDVLRVSGHEVLSATDGLDALGVLGRVGSVDVVLLDLHMPVMDGPRFLEERARTPYATIPVVVLSAWADRRVLPDVYAKLTKPVQISDLLDVVQRATASSRAPSSAAGRG